MLALYLLGSSKQKRKVASISPKSRYPSTGIKLVPFLGPTYDSQRSSRAWDKGCEDPWKTTGSILQKMLITLGFLQLNLADGSSWLVLYIILFIYFWLCESLLLHGTFSSCGEWRLHSSWGAWTSLCGGFSPHSKALGLWGSTSCDTGSGVTALGLWGTGSIAVERWLSCPQAVGSCGVRDWTHVPCTDRWILHHWATRETPNWLIPNGLVFQKMCCPWVIMF